MARRDATVTGHCRGTSAASQTSTTHVVVVTIIATIIPITIIIAIGCVGGGPSVGILRALRQSRSSSRRMGSHRQVCLAHLATMPTAAATTARGWRRPRPSDCHDKEYGERNDNDKQQQQQHATTTTRRVATHTINVVGRRCRRGRRPQRC